MLRGVTKHVSRVFNVNMYLMQCKHLKITVYKSIGKRAVKVHALITR